MRLDKFLCQQNMGSRSEVKKLIRNGKVTVNGKVIREEDHKVQEQSDEIICCGTALTYREYAYYMCNKPRGVVSATTDRKERTVIDVLKPFLAECDCKRNIVPCGRLDKDTEGLLLLTDDGALMHDLLSPTKHVEKTYLVTIQDPLTDEQIACLESGVDIGEKRRTKPARVEILSSSQLLLSITEGKFHQVKRMMQAVGAPLTALKRLKFGPLDLDLDLKEGECRALTESEIKALKTVQKSHSIKAIIFDLDGTLVDSMWIWHQIDVEYLGKFNLPVPDSLQQDIEGMSFVETAHYFKERFHIEDSVETIMSDWNEMALEKYEKEVPLKPGAKDFLALCKGKGYKLGIATSNSRELAKRVTEVHEIDSYFDCIITGSEVLKGKPAPDIYLAAMKKLQVSPAECIVFEDILPGIQAGKNAGMRVCAVEDRYSMDIKAMKMKAADYYISSYEELLKGDSI